MAQVIKLHTNIPGSVISMITGGSYMICVKRPRSFHWTKKATIHQLTTMLSTSKNVLFSRYNHLLTTGDDDPTLLIIARAPARVIIKVKGHQRWWLAGGYDLEIGLFRGG